MTETKPHVNSATASENPGFGTLLTLANAFLPSLAGGLPRHVTTPPIVPTDGSMEARVLKAERRYQTLVEHIPVVTFMVSFENRKSEIYVSPYVEKLLGYTSKEWVEDPILWYQRLYPEDRGRWNTEFSRTIALAEPFKGDYRFLAKDGRIVWIHGEVTVARDESGRPSFLQGIGYEITELKQAEEVLQRSREDLDGLVKERTLEITAANKSLENEIKLRERVEANMRQSLKELADVKAASMNTPLSPSPIRRGKSPTPTTSFAPSRTTRGRNSWARTTVSSILAIIPRSSCVNFGALSARAKCGRGKL